MTFKNGIDTHIIIRFVNIISPYYNKININQGDMEVFFVNYDFLKDLSVDNLMQFDQKIASFTRHSGTDEEYQAFLYMKEKYESFGYRTELVLHDAYISLPVSAKLTVNGTGVYAQTHSMVPSTPTGGISGPVVYVPEKKLSNLKHGSLKGKILAVDGRATFPLVKKVSRLDPVGLICIQEDPIRECIPSGAWGSPDTHCEGLYPEIPIVSVRESETAWIRDGKEYKACMETEVDTGWRKIPSLTAFLDVCPKSEKYVMFTGHLDSWYYGAIDNGTVNAAQLEVARLVAKNKDKLKRNFRLVNFSGHSHGRYAGSAWYALENWMDLHKNCVANINADSIGGKKSSDITHSLIMPETLGLAKEVVKTLTGEDFQGIRCLRNADQSFWICGVSSAFASFSKQPKIKQPDGTASVGKGNAPLGWWWHTPGDLPENIDPDNFKRDVSIFAAYIMEFLCRDVIPLDFSRTAERILAVLQSWQEKSCGILKLEREVRLAERLKKTLEEHEFTAEENNKKLKLGRILVPLLNTTGNIYRNDNAENYPEIPSLMLIDQLKNVEPDSMDRMEYLTELMQKKNYVAYSLNSALELMNSEED